MDKIEMQDIGLPSEEDWDYYCSFKSPKKYLHEIEISLSLGKHCLGDFRFLKLMNWYAQQTDIRTTPKCGLQTGVKMIRARIYDKKEDTEDKGPEFRGYGPKGSFVPPENALVRAGRANPEGITYLYAATDERTAIAEVNPSCDSTVSVGKIAVQSQLKIMNLANLFASSSGSDNRITRWKRHFTLELTRAFNTPYNSPDKYILCQQISECIKNLGYDGIRFASSKVKTDWDKQLGINYAIFNYQKCAAISSELYSAEDVKRILGKKINGLYMPYEE